ncbi:hypothetical protein SASPL_119954 [Salvia splendens]|uniref:CTP synthase n=1 Tax=Salvia splendens TaxID=180675 RepID=A0A8X8ZV60_SALSN|nr:hypothetical protein SASPL_119954 [Salvia splendens]
MKYVLVTGGVVSGLGKGVTASSIGVVLKACGLRVTSIKIEFGNDDWCDAGTMSPFEHGEVFVLDDGGEVDLDLGNYERFLDVRLTRDNNITTGKIYQSVLEQERRGDYLGKTVVPHITEAIKNWIESVSHIPVDGKEGPADVCVIELGGTVGDIESMPFIEALRQLLFSVGQNNFCLIHVSLIPVLGVVGEQPLLENTRQKLSQFCHVPVSNILNIHDVPNIWHIPLLLRSQNAHDAILTHLELQSVANTPNLQEWTDRAETFDNLSNSVSTIPLNCIPPVMFFRKSDENLSALTGENCNGREICWNGRFLSVSGEGGFLALLHACIACSLKPAIDWIAASDLEDDNALSTPEAQATAWRTLKNAACILVPGGFGDRGVKGMLLAAKYARENKVPYLGICLGMQISVIEFARNVLGMERANSSEFDKDTPNPVVIFMPEGSKTHMGSTMRLGSRRTLFQTPDCLTAKLYHNSEHVDERHRHRYEVNPEMVNTLEKSGLKFVGKDETGKRMEILELKDHPFYVGAQFHPEFKSRPGRPSPLFLGFILAAIGQLGPYLQNPRNGSL